MVSVVVNIAIRKLVHFISNVFPVFMRRWEIQIYWQETLFCHRTCLLPEFRKGTSKTADRERPCYCHSTEKWRHGSEPYLW